MYSFNYRSSKPIVVFFILTFGNFTSLTLNASNQADTINITSTASGLATTVNADGGLDTFGAIDQTTIAAAVTLISSAVMKELSLKKVGS